MADDNEKVSVDQYGRKKWDIEAYAAESKRRKKNNDKKEVAGPRIETDKSESYLNHRQDVYLQLTRAVNKFTIVNPLANYGKQKKFGFLCPICDLSYRDNLGLINHLNSPQHLNKVKAETKFEGDEERPEIDGVKPATVEEVRATIEKLVQQQLAADEPQQTLEDRIEKRRQFEEKQVKKRRDKRRERKRKKSVSEDDEILATMGFGKFG